MSDDRTPLIVHVILRLDVGGMENGVVNLINAMPADRFRHAIICLKDCTNFRDRLTALNVEIHALDKQQGKDIGVYFRMWRLLRRISPEIVHTRNLGTVDMQVPAFLAGVPYRVHGEHGWDMIDLFGQSIKYRLLRRLCRLFISRYIAVSANLRDWLVNTIGVPSGKVVHICNGVDTHKFFPAKQGSDYPRDWPFRGTDDFVIGAIGRLVEVKDQISLIEAFALLLKRMPAAHLRLVIVGDGPLYDKLVASLDARGVSAASWLPGRRDDVADLLRHMDLFVLPSLNEGISNTILEAMASGLPVIATDVGGNPELVRTGENGALVPTNAPNDLADAIYRYVDNPELLERHGREARAGVVRDRSLDRMINSYVEFYQEVMG